MKSAAGGFAAGCRLALLTPTDLEAEPLLGHFSQVEKARIAGKSWYRGPLERGALFGGGPRTAAASGAEVLLIVSGYDKANTAHALTCLLEAQLPGLVLQFGVAGAFPGQGLGVRDLVLATTEIYADTGSSSPEGWLSTESFCLPVAEVGGRSYYNEFPLDTGLVARAAALLGEVDWGMAPPVVATGPCVTLSQVTGLAKESASLQRRWQALAETMEGAAAAHICALYGVPFLEVRSVSNLVSDRDRDSWDLQVASERAARAAALLALRLDRLEAGPGRKHEAASGRKHEAAPGGGN